jgi:hypothetical protein
VSAAPTNAATAQCYDACHSGNMARVVIVRSVGLVGVAILTQLLAAMDTGPDANIGLGLVLQLLLSAVVAVWAATDGVRLRRRTEDLALPVAVWLLVSVVVAVVESVLISIRGAVSGMGFSTHVLVDDVLSVSPVSAVFLAVPALLSLLTAVSTGWTSLRGSA